MASRCLRARARKVSRSLRSLRPDSPDEALHALRILIKKLRYAIEFFGPVLGRQARKAVAPLARAQDLLGAHQDAAVMCDLLARLAAKRPSDAPLQGAAQALTLLYRQRQREQRAALPETMSGDLFARIERLAARR
jgi:CHAD domain-containing protein